MKSLHYYIYFLIIGHLSTLTESIQDCDGKAYGRDCRVSCDSCTGDCDTDGFCKSLTCHPPWSGENCQKYNIAFKKPTKQSSTLSNLESRLVVDGDTGLYSETRSCSSTQEEENTSPCVTVDLQSVHLISEIVVFPRIYNESSLHNAIIYVSNNSDESLARSVCSRLSSVIQSTSAIPITCDNVLRGRYVTIEKSIGPGSNGRLLTFCEIQVWECSDGTYGDKCQHVCGDCVGGHEICDKLSGVCPSGCLPGRMPPLCDKECPLGSYGQDCVNKCRSCSGNTRCDLVSGLCTEGCASGWRGLYCDQACNGICVDICGHCLGGTSCDLKHNTGVCPAGCLAGYQPPYCKIRCSSRFYGINCTTPCGYCKKNQSCGVITGECPNGCSSGWLGDRCDQAMSVTEEPNVNIGAIVGGIILTIFVIVAAIVLYLLKTKKWYVKKKKPVSHVLENPAYEHPISVPPIYGYGPAPSAANNMTLSESDVDVAIIPNGNTLMTNGIKRQSTDQTDSPNSHRGISEGPKTLTNGYIIPPPTSISLSPTTVSIDQLQQYVDRKRSHPLGYGAEFQLLIPEPTSPTTFGHLPFNRIKNRFASIVPYDYNRVVLKTIDKDPLFDYINASYIAGINRKRAYIVTQAPLDSFIFDFWRMVWQEFVTKIIVLTNMAELGKVKCAQYWSEFESKQFGHLIVQLDSALELTDYTLRLFTVTNAVSGESRIVRQYHYTSWPDHCIPTNTESLLSFRQLTLDREDKRPPPIVVHCSAGIGRSGTYVAIDILINQAIHDQTIDVFACVQKLRQQRVMMIPSVEQYRYIHDVVLDYVNFGATSIRYTEFVRHYYRMKQDGSSHILHQFHNIQEKCRVSLDDIHTALAMDNVHKNRNHHILAGDTHRLYLSTHIPGTTDYINAVKVHGCKDTTVMFANELPLPHTIVDLWRLVNDHSSATIVLLGDIDYLQENVGVYWSEEPTVSVVEPFQVEMVSSQQVNDVTIERMFRVKPIQGISKERIVKLFHFTRLYQEQTTLPDMGELLTLIENVARWQHDNSSPPVIVQCLDGATYTGLYCTIVNLIEQLDLLKSVDVCQTVRMLRSARPQFIPSMEQYEYLYDIVNFYLTHQGNY